MKIKISEIPKEGLYTHTIYDPQELDLESSDISFLEPIDIRAEIMLVQDQLLVNVKVATKLSLICVRCLSKYELSFTKKYFFQYNVRNLTVIDIQDDLRQELILDYPLKPLCQQDCQGICPKCGVNKNIEDCKCNKKEG